MEIKSYIRIVESDFCSALLSFARASQPTGETLPDGTPAVHFEVRGYAVTVKPSKTYEDGHHITVTDKDGNTVMDDDFERFEAGPTFFDTVYPELQDDLDKTAQM